MSVDDFLQVWAEVPLAELVVEKCPQRREVVIVELVVNKSEVTPKIVTTLTRVFGTLRPLPTP